MKRCPTGELFFADAPPICSGRRAVRRIRELHCGGHLLLPQRARAVAALCDCVGVLTDLAEQAGPVLEKEQQEANPVEARSRPQSQQREEKEEEGQRPFSVINQVWPVNTLHAIALPASVLVALACLHKHPSRTVHLVQAQEEQVCVSAPSPAEFCVLYERLSVTYVYGIKRTGWELADTHMDTRSRQPCPLDNGS